MGNGISTLQKESKKRSPQSSDSWVRGSAKMQNKMKWAEQFERENLYEKEVKLCKKYVKKYPEMDTVLKTELGPKAARFKTMASSALAEDLSESTVTIDELMETLNEIHSIVLEYVYKEKRRTVCYYLATTGSVSKECADLYHKAISQYGQINSENIESPNKGQRLQGSLIEFLNDICDKSFLAANQMEDYGVLESVIKSIAGVDAENNLDGAMMKWVNKLFIMVYNCVKSGVSLQYLNSLKALETIEAFNQYEEARMLIAFLSCELDSHDKQLFDDGAVTMLLNLFIEAVENPNKIASNGLGIEELSIGIITATSFDKNKRSFVKKGILPHLIKLSKEGDEEQIQAALEILWTLSYNEENKREMVEDSMVIESIKKWSSCKNYDIRKPAVGAMWNLHGIKPEKKEKDNKAEAVTENIDSSVPHVMISYQWDVQKLMLKVRDELKKRGYKIWMDVDEMGGSTLEAMAGAVEGAAVVLICMSSKYKDSPNCRAEGEYAFETKTDIVPLLVEKGYKANGWLGPVIGSKYYIDFTTKVSSFDNYIDSVVRELGNRGRLTGVVEQRVERVEEKGLGDLNGTLPPSREGGSRNITAWTAEQVQTWAEDHDISNHILSMTGEDLITLLELRSEAPEYFYNHVDKKLGISTIGEIGKLRKALDSLKN